MIKSTIFNAAKVKHAFFTREGGISDGIYRGLNCGAGSKDAPENVAHNKSIAMQALGVTTRELATLYQIHSTEIVHIKDHSQIKGRPKADALVTRLPGVALGILTADCVPLLFADTENNVIGAAHSGWKGSIGEIARKTIETMIEAGANRSSINVAVGPAIQQNSYEVGPEFPTPFLKLDKNNDRFFHPSAREGHFMFDLTGFVLSQLMELNVGKVDRIMRDTCAEEETFYSYRRMCKQGEKDYGRLLSAITLIDE